MAKISLKWLVIDAIEKTIGPGCTECPTCKIDIFNLFPPWSRSSVQMEMRQINASMGWRALLYSVRISTRISTHQSSTIISYFLLIHYKFTHFDSSEWSRNTTLMQLPFAAHYSAQRAICMIMIRHLPVFNGNSGANLRSLPFYRNHCLFDPASTGCLAINT